MDLSGKATCAVALAHQQLYIIKMYSSVQELMPEANELVCDFLQMWEPYIYMCAYVYVHTYI